MPLNSNSNPSPNPPPESQSLSRTILVFLIWLLVLNLLIFRSATSSQVPYSQFIEQLEADQVSKVEVHSNQIEYTLKSDGLATDTPETRVTVPLANDTELPQLLRQHQVEVSAYPEESGWLAASVGWILLLLVFVGGWIWLLSRGSGGNSATAFNMGKSKARIYGEGSTGVTFADVAGVDEAKVELQEIIDFLSHTEKYTNLGAKIPKGVLLIGPPGTGKTLLAKAIAGEASVPFFSISGSEFIELFVGVGASRVRDLFEQAKREAPCIVFIDELDALGKSRAGIGSMLNGNDEREQTLNQLLAEMDGFEENTGVILLAATNRPEVLDPALLRPGRFDRQVVVDRPDKIGREAILAVHARQVKLGPDVNLTKLAARTPGFAGADLANLVNEAALLAARNDQTMVTMADFNAAIERILTGLEKKSRVLNEVEKKTVAYHEVGHAIIGALMPGAGEVEKISIVPRGVGALGYTLQLPEEDRFLMLEDEIRGRIVTLLAGRSAEELVFGKVSTGASDDIQKATDLAERFVTLYGMSHKLGPMAFERAQQQFLNGFSNPRRPVSPQVTEEIDREVKSVIDGAHQMAIAILQQNQILLNTIAQQLIETEVLEGETLRSHLNQVQTKPEIEQWLRTGEIPDLTPGNGSRSESTPVSNYKLSHS
jgi:cell division protease FtsH